jgi:hypothetical protein
MAKTPREIEGLKIETVRLNSRFERVEWRP